jgi:hypothetical protein
MAGSKKPSVPRRDFLKGTAIAAMASLVPDPGTLPLQSAPLTSAQKSETHSSAEVLTEGPSGSDFMVDVIKSLGFAARIGHQLRGEPQPGTDHLLP